MGLISRAIERRSTVKLGLNDPALIEMFGGRVNAAGQNVTPDTALRTSAVYCCVSILAGTLAALPKNVKEEKPNGGREILPLHRCHRLVRHRPNRWQSAFEFFQMMEGHRLLRGNAYAEIIYHPGRQENELIPMHPDMVWPFIVTPKGHTYFLSETSQTPSYGSKLFYRYVSADGEDRTISAENVLHLKDYSINGIVGISRIKWAAFQAVGLAMATEEHGSRLFTNGAQIGKVFKHPGKLSDPARKNLKESLTEQHAGVSNAHKTLLLEEGMDIAKIGMTAEESQFLETRKFQVEDIFRIYRVPLMLGAAGDKAPTFASAEQFLTLFKAVTMHENVRCWEEAMECRLLNPSDLGKIVIDIDMDSLVRGDIVARAKYLRERFNMASMTPDEIRMYEDENPTGTDEGMQLYVQSGTLPAKMAGQKPLAPTGKQI